MTASRGNRFPFAPRGRRREHRLRGWAREAPAPRVSPTRTAANALGTQSVQAHAAAVMRNTCARVAWKWCPQPDLDGIALPGMPAGAPGMGGDLTGPLVVYGIRGGEVVGEFGSY